MLSGKWNITDVSKKLSLLFFSFLTWCFCITVLLSHCEFCLELLLQSLEFQSCYIEKVRYLLTHFPYLLVGYVNLFFLLVVCNSRLCNDGHKFFALTGWIKAVHYDVEVDIKEQLCSLFLHLKIVTVYVVHTIKLWTQQWMFSLFSFS